MIEQFEWDGEAGMVWLTDGSQVLVQPGDVLMGEEGEDGEVVFHSHARPKHN